MHKILVSLFVLLPVLAQAQSTSQLSDEGYAHWTAATRLLESASHVEDYFVIADEYEQVLVSDPQFEKTYLELVHIYEKIGIEKGAAYFNKAVVVLNKYKSRKPEESRMIEAERSVIQAMKKKYVTSLSIEGTWRNNDGHNAVDIIIVHGTLDGRNWWSVSSLTWEGIRYVPFPDNDYDFSPYSGYILNQGKYSSTARRIEFTFEKAPQHESGSRNGKRYNSTMVQYDITAQINDEGYLHLHIRQNRHYLYDYGNDNDSYGHFVDLERGINQTTMLLSRM